MNTAGERGGDCLGSGSARKLRRMAVAQAVLGVALVLIGGSYFVRGDPAKRGVTQTRAGGRVMSRTQWYWMAWGAVLLGVLQLILGLAGK